MSDDEIYEYLEQEFEWNRMKAAQNLIEHGVEVPRSGYSVFR